MTSPDGYGIPELEIALIRVRTTLIPRAAKNDTIALLDEVADMADGLVKKLVSISGQVTPAHAQANALIEVGYWKHRPDDVGAFSLHAVGPRIESLAVAAREGKAMLPITPTRHRTADPAPVEAIADALRRGWNKEHGSNVFRVHLVDGKEVLEYPNGPMRKPFPQEFQPSLADSSPFRAIVGICYESAGGNSDPVAAIRAYLKREKELRKEPAAALDRALAEIEAEKKRPRNRTSRKK